MTQQKRTIRSSGYSFTSWPAVPPVFEAISTPTHLRVPLSAYLPTEQVELLAAGTLVPPGARLVAPIEGAHAPLSPCAARVVGISDATMLTGLPVRVVELECDESSEPPDPVWSAADDMSGLERLPQAPSQTADWIERIRSAGVWAARRTSPDLLGQLHQSLRRPIDTILCSVLDADPSACLHAALAAQFPLELVAGVKLLRAITRARRAWIAVDAGIPSTWTTAFRHAAKSEIKLVPMVNVYPQADPTLLLYTLLGRRLRPMRLPTDQGVIALDAAAAIAVGRVALADDVRDGSMLSAPLALRDHMLRQSFFLFAAVGATIADVVGQTRVSDTCTVFRAGDLLRDVVVPDTAVIAGGELIVHASPPEPAINPDACIRCGWCVDSCPTRVQPAGVLEAAQHDDVALAEHFGIEACIECGVCSYVCPSRLPLLPSIREMRQIQGRGRAP